MEELESFSFSQPVASTSRAVFTLPYKGPASIHEEEAESYELLARRQALYEEAWGKCEARIKTILSTLHDASLDQIVRFVDESRNTSTSSLRAALTGRPFIPTGLIIGTSPGSSSLLFTALSRQLAHKESTELRSERNSCIVSRIRSTDCTKIKNALRAILAGFIGTEIERDDEMEEEQTSAPIQTTAALVPEDLRNLLAWYSHHYGGKQGPTLVVLLEDLEAMDAVILSQILVALSQYVDKLPFVFLIGVATSPLALHDFVPKDVLNLLETETFFVEPGIGAFNALMRGLFVDWLPPLGLGPKVYQYLWKTFEDMHHSIDATVSGLQFLYMHHFTTKSYAFLTVVDAEGLVLPPEIVEDSRLLLRELRSGKSVPWVDELCEGGDELDVVSRKYVARAGWQQSLQIGFAVLMYMQDFWGNKAPTEKLLLMLSQGTLWVHAEKVCRNVLEASSSKISAFLKGLVKELERLHSEFPSLPTDGLFKTITTYLSGIEGAISNAPRIDGRLNLTNTNSKGFYPALRLSKEDIEFSRLAKGCSDHLSGTFRGAFCPSSGLNLYELWFSDDVSALKQFHPSILPSFERTLQPKLADGIPEPDIVVAYRLYRETGKMINVGDWWRAFEQTAPDEPDLEEEDEEAVSRKGKESASAKRKRNGGDMEDDSEKESDAGEEDDEDEEEEVEDVRLRRKQARFLRAVGDLAFAGFLQPTLKKAEHVLKSVF